MPTKTTPPKPTLWHQLYFVLASLIGLICIVIGASVFLNTLLTSTVFKTNQPNYNMPPEPISYQRQVAIDELKESDELTEEQKATVARWEKEYQRWEEEQRNFDWEANNRKQSFAWSLSLLITGVPIFALHAPVVFGWGKRR